MGVHPIRFSLAFMLALGLSHVHGQTSTLVHTEVDTEETTVDASAPIEIVEEKYDDGRVRVRRETTLDSAGNYVNHGQWTMFSPDGKEVASGTLNNGKRQGHWTRTYDWGEAALLANAPFSMFEAPFTSAAEFENGELHGVWTITDHQGRVVTEWNYRNGFRDGIARWNYPSGDPMEEISYKFGKIDGSHKTWSEEGQLVVNDTFQEGRKLESRRELYPSGVVMWEGMFLHETHVITKKDRWWSAQPVVYAPQGKPERHGKFTSWYESGQKKFEGVFQNEVRNGEFNWWHENSQLAVAGAFRDDIRHGDWNWWHKNGQKAIQGKYAEGALDGKWAYWTETGKLSLKVDYNKESQPVAMQEIPSTDVPESIADSRNTPAAETSR